MAFAWTVTMAGMGCRSLFTRTSSSILAWSVDVPHSFAVRVSPLASVTWMQSRSFGGEAWTLNPEGDALLSCGRER